MFSRSASIVASLCLFFLTTYSKAQQSVFVAKGDGVCVDSASAQYDYIETAGVTSIAGCQNLCTSLDASNLRGLEYEAASQGCLCLYENGAGAPGNAFFEVGAEAGVGPVAGTNATFSTFQCYSYSGGSFFLVGTGGCVDSNADFYSYATPFNVQGTQTAATCQNACVAAGTNGLIGLDYNGECYCLYTSGSAPTIASTTGVFTNGGTGNVASTSTFPGVICQGFELSEYNTVDYWNIECYYADHPLVAFLQISYSCSYSTAYSRSSGCHYYTGCSCFYCWEGSQDQVCQGSNY